ncbi:MAG: hypothetical protein NTU44_15605 [Bacteroidetes bacterium]|nr:hypothetical protein [Bacteroidota bacterium]
MKKINEVYYTVSTIGGNDFGSFQMVIVKLFNAGDILKDRQAALDYISEKKEKSQFTKFMLSLIISDDKESYTSLVLFNDLKFDTDIPNLGKELEVLEKLDMISELECTRFCNTHLIKASDGLIDLILRHEFEMIVSESRNSYFVEELFKKYGSSLVNYVLMLSVEYVNFEVLKICHKYGADLSYEDNLPLRKVLYLENRFGCILNDTEDVALYLCENINDRQPFEIWLGKFAAECGFIRLLEYLFQNITYTKEDKDEMFYCACLERSLDGVKYLMDKLEDFTSVSKESLKKACYSGGSKVAIYLVEMGTDISEIAAEVIEYAAKWYMFDFIKYVVDGFDVKANTFINALNIAIDYGKEGTAFYLMDKGTVPNDNTFRVLGDVYKYGVVDTNLDERFPEGPEFIERVMEFIIEKYPEYKPQISHFFTPKLKEKYPEYATGADFNLF